MAAVVVFSRRAGHGRAGGCAAAVARRRTMPGSRPPPPWPLHPIRTTSLASLGLGDDAALRSGVGATDANMEGGGVRGEGYGQVHGPGSHASPGSGIDQMPTFASNMRAAFGAGSTGLVEAEDSCYSKRWTASMSPTQGGASLACVEPEADDAARCFACLPRLRWGNRAHNAGARTNASDSEEGGDSCQAGRTCGDSRSEGRRRSFWAREERGEGQEDLDRSQRDMESPTKASGIARRLRELEEGLRSLAVSHSHLKLEHGGKLDELEAAFARVLETARGNKEDVRIGEERRVRSETATEAALRQEIIDVKAQLAHARDETQKQMAALEAKWSMVSAFESRWSMVASTAQVRVPKQPCKRCKRAIMYTSRDLLTAHISGCASCRTGCRHTGSSSARACGTCLAA